MILFIDQYRDEYGVEPICNTLPIAPSTYYEHKSLERDPSRRSARAQRDDDLKIEIKHIWHEHNKVYGVRKVWRQMHREGIQVARCTVSRLMRE